jgi:hypothetical protein
MMTGPEPAFVLLRADGVRVVAVCPKRSFAARARVSPTTPIA